MKKKPSHIIKEVRPGSIAEELELEPGDELLRINDTELEDIFDYHYMTEDSYLEVLIKKPDGEEWLLEIDKDEDEDLGIIFENGLLDEYRSCCNKCIFCFIDQMPKGMRETLYFKDDDSRLSFLQGNYVTLTNMSEHDIDRIIKFRLEPINISFQTTNPELRCMMLNNRFAGEALKKVDLLYEAGIHMNGQIVLCKGINDGKELERTISDLTGYFPYLESVSVVPVGLTKFREGLYPLEPFEKEDSLEVLKIIHKWQDKMYEEHGMHFVHASDEWYFTAGIPLPEEDSYDGYLQLENGVGMGRLLIEEVEEALEGVLVENEKGELVRDPSIKTKKETVTMVCGKLVEDFIGSLAGRVMEYFPEKTIKVRAIRNDFFGERITVTGLITGQDIIAQLKNEDLGDRVTIPVNMLRSGEEVFLDDITLSEVANALQVRVDIVKSGGEDFLNMIIM